MTPELLAVAARHDYAALFALHTLMGLVALVLRCCSRRSDK
jgi:hypothetical protein